VRGSEADSRSGARDNEGPRRQTQIAPAARHLELVDDLHRKSGLVVSHFGAVPQEEIMVGFVVARLTTFSIANDVAKYFAIIPAAFASTYPQLNALNVMRLASPFSAILSAVIFNAVIIVFLNALALKGVKYRPLGAASLLRRNLVVYGLGGILIPFAGIKLIDMGLTLGHLT
jgi:hypothetical protein